MFLPLFPCIEIIKSYANVQKLKHVFTHGTVAPKGGGPIIASCKRVTSSLFMPAKSCMYISPINAQISMSPVSLVKDKKEADTL